MEKEFFVIELPLKIEKWEADLINKRYELLRSIYNYAQNKLLRQFKYFEQMTEWKNCKTKKDKSDFFKKHPSSQNHIGYAFGGFILVLCKWFGINLLN